jgi:hypothetical protein
MVVLLHASVNLPQTLVIDDLGSRATVPILLYWGLMIVAAIVVVVMAGPKHLSRKQRKQEELTEISPKSSVYEVQAIAQPQTH